ncbi:MAG: galactokinase [Flavobacteriales bacterium]|nr:galactokinase [Flavobacteriales bacterium]
MESLSVQFNSLFGHLQEPKRFFCPGRVNLIGEHIDYLGGSVMPAAISLGITALCSKNDSNILRIHSTDFPETIAFDLAALPVSKQGNWGDFILGVVLDLKDKGIEPSGCDILFESNLPKGSGLSSSAALEVLCYHMFHVIATGTEPDRTKMALYCQKIENQFIGVNCGIMDQFAVANGKAQHALLLNCESLAYKLVPLQLGTHELLIINSNKPRTLAESAYNQRRQECDDALRIIQKERPIGNLVDAHESELELLCNPILKKRTRHAIGEQIRVMQSAVALRAGNLEEFGRLMTESHNSLKDDYEVSCSELDFIVEQLLASDACLGARMTGAGFGGCCVALVDKSAVASLSEQLGNGYQKRFGFEPSFYSCLTSDGVHTIT